MKEFLVYVHAQLNKILSLYKLSEKLTKEENELLNWLSGAVLVIENFAEKTGDGKLYQIAEDMDYAVNHMWVWFKAESALKDVEENISKYN